MPSLLRSPLDPVLLTGTECCSLIAISISAQAGMEVSGGRGRRLRGASVRGSCCRWDGSGVGVFSLASTVTGTSRPFRCARFCPGSMQKSARLSALRNSGSTGSRIISTVVDAVVKRSGTRPNTRAIVRIVATASIHASLPALLSRYRMATGCFWVEVTGIHPISGR